MSKVSDNQINEVSDNQINEVSDDQIERTYSKKILIISCSISFILGSVCSLIIEYLIVHGEHDHH